MEYNYKTVLARFRENLMENEKAEATIRKYIYETERLIEFLGEREIKKELILEYRESLQEKCEARTVNGKLSAVNSFLSFIGKSECRVKFLKVQHQVFIAENRELSQKEYKRLLYEAKKKGDERLYYLMLTIGNTGIRVSELKYITVEAVKRGRAEIFLKGKNRTVLIPKGLKCCLEVYARKIRKSRGCIFCTRSGAPMDRSNICHEMKRLCERANVDSNKVFPHNLRHLFARTYYAVEKNLAHLADILGHSSVETTRIYVAASVREHENTFHKMRLII